jgi:hypothetical protein
MRYSDSATAVCVHPPRPRRVDAVAATLSLTDEDLTEDGIAAFARAHGWSMNWDLSTTWSKTRGLPRPHTWDRFRREADEPWDDRIDRRVIEYRGDRVESGAGWIYACEDELCHEEPMETFSQDTSIDRVLAWMARPVNPNTKDA